MPDSLRALGVLLATAFRADPWRATGTLLMTILGSLLSTFVAYWLKFLADGALAADLTRVSIGATAIAVSVAGSTYLNWTSFKLRTNVAERTSLRIDRELISLSAGLPGLEQHERADYLDRLALLRRHREVMTQTIAAATNNLGVIVRVGSTVALLASIHPVLVLLPAFGLPALWAGAKAASIEQQALDESVERERSADHLFELATTPGPGKELRVFGAGDALSRRHDGLWQEIDRVRTRAGVAGALLSGAAWLLFAAGYVGAIVFVAAQAARGNATPGDVLMAVTLAGQVNAHVERVVFLVGYLMRVLKIVGKMVWLMDYARAARAADHERVPAPDRLERGIAFEGVSFRYPGTDADVLTNASLFLPAGSTVAIVGENGAGKTTIVKLLSRFYAPTEGRITVDGTDLADLDVDQWRARMSAGFQDFERFEFLARETVGVGELSRLGDAAFVSAALDRAAAADVVPTLPKGLETQLGKSFDDGVELSGGQWQKLALGRAMMRPAPLLLVLDEPTASLDAETEHALFERYSSATARVARAKGGITILVSHRFSTVRMADQIVVVDGGRVVDAGSHDELVSRGGLYAELYALQARSYQ